MCLFLYAMCFFLYVISHMRFCLHVICVSVCVFYRYVSLSVRHVCFCMCVICVSLCMSYSTCFCLLVMQLCTSISVCMSCASGCICLYVMCFWLNLSVCYLGLCRYVICDLAAYLAGYPVLLITAYMASRIRARYRI